MSKVSVITTVLNEGHTITRLLDALLAQTHQPDEVIIVDGGSRDMTMQRLRAFREQHPSFPLQVFEKKGNRSVGRNWAVQKAHADLIAITDAGCVPHRDWLAELLAVTPSKKEFVIAGYYDAEPRTPFEEAVVPYVLVMPDKVNPLTFLPATRSMLMTKNVWERFGGFDERLSDNEDYAFARKISVAHVPILFAEKAKVTWLPPQNIEHFWWMIYRFARGDVYSGILRNKVVLLFVRYFVLCIVSIGIGVMLGVWPLLGTWVVLAALYMCWAVKKNKKYVPRGWYWLPVLQIAADKAVLTGTTLGSWKRFMRVLSNHDIGAQK